MRRAAPPAQPELEAGTSGPERKPRAATFGLRLPAWLKYGVGGIIVLLSFYFLIGRLVRDWNQVRLAHLHLSAGRLVLAFGILFFLHFPLYGWLWSTILRALGSPVSVLKSIAITSVSAVGKYVPGKVWFTLGRMTLVRKEGVTEGTTLLSVVLEIAFTLFAGIIILGTGILFLPRSQVPSAVYFLFLLAPACLAVMYPPVLNRILRIPLRWLKRPPLELHIPYHVLLGILGLCLLDWLAQGIGCYVLINSFAHLPISRLPVMLGGYAVSWMIGFLVLLTPAGLGVREGIFTLILRTVLSEPIAIVAALVTRVWIAVGELVAALVGFVLLRTLSGRTNEKGRS